MDDDSDLSDLPTSTSEGLNQNDGVSHKKADKGSKAFAISSSKNYVLNSSDEWTEINRRMRVVIVDSPFIKESYHMAISKAIVPLLKVEAAKSFMATLESSAIRLYLEK